MAAPVKNVTIVGGGTAGWLAAISLVTYLKWRPGDSDMRITLIESPNVPTVGVGEATVPSMAHLLNQCGVDEAEFFRRTNATFKMGVLFAHWNKWPDGSFRDFFQAFNSPHPLGGFSPGYAFQRYRKHPQQDYVDSVVPTLSVVGRLKGPRPIGSGAFEKPMSYAYHLDAGLFAQYLKELAVERGVVHIRDDVVDVNQAENGMIKSLNLKQWGTFPVELVLDCTGFRGLILNDALKVPFISYSDHLLCDRAAAVQIPHPNQEQLVPYTSSTALTAGWVWRVPLFNRIGTGYVFSSRYKSDDEAVAELLDYLGDSAEGREPRVLRMRVGRAERSWAKNCVAIGLSGGFIEPLESTAIYMIESAIRWLVAAWPTVDMPEPLQKAYNERMVGLQDEIRDFIVTHYLLNNRDEPFWRAAREDIVVPDSVRERMELWRYALPGEHDLGQTHLFNHWNYQYVLFGKGFYDGVQLPLSEAVNEQEWQQYQSLLLGLKKELVQHMPDHRTLVASIRGDEAQLTSSTEEAIL